MAIPFSNKEEIKDFAQIKVEDYKGVTAAYVLKVSGIETVK